MANQMDPIATDEKRIQRAAELKKMNRLEIHEKLCRMVNIEREILHEIILLIKEIDSRSLPLEMGYAGLFDYLTRAIGYSEGSAQRRIDAVRLIREVPEAIKKIASGELNLSQVSLLQKSARESQKITGVKISTDQKKDLVDKIVGTNYRNSEQIIAGTLKLPTKSFEKQRFQSNDSVRIEMTLSNNAYGKVLKAQDLLSHSLPYRDMAAYVEFVTDKIIKQKMGRHLAIKKDAMNSLSESEPLNDFENDINPGFLSMQECEGASSERVRVLMLALYKHCQYTNANSGIVCGSQWQLQVDHIKPVWAGGENNLSNYRLLCAKHNQHKYKIEAGIKKVEPPF